MEKCYKCNKSKMIIIKCKCERNFCIKCKLPETHKCKFDYKNEARENILKKNPKVIGEKIIKI